MNLARGTAKLNNEMRKTSLTSPPTVNHFLSYIRGSEAATPATAKGTPILFMI